MSKKCIANCYRKLLFCYHNIFKKQNYKYKFSKNILGNSYLLLGIVIKKFIIICNNEKKKLKHLFMFFGALLPNK